VVASFRLGRLFYFCRFEIIHNCGFKVHHVTGELM
jgi:hypothetical protein